MNDNLLSTKFLLALIGIGLCVIWAAFKLEKEYLIMALGFVTGYGITNVAQKFRPEQ